MNNLRDYNYTKDISYRLDLNELLLQDNIHLDYLDVPSLVLLLHTNGITHEFNRSNLNGNGYGYGDGYGDGNGYGYGDANGDGFGFGFGNGNGYGDGHGYGNGNGNGIGYDNE